MTQYDSIHVDLCLVCDRKQLKLPESTECKLCRVIGFGYLCL